MRIMDLCYFSHKYHSFILMDYVNSYIDTMVYLYICVYVYVCVYVYIYACMYVYVCMEVLLSQIANNNTAKTVLVDCYQMGPYNITWHYKVYTKQKCMSSLDQMSRTTRLITAMGVHKKEYGKLCLCLY